MEALLNYKEPAPEVTYADLYQIFKQTNEFQKITKYSKNRYERVFKKFEPIHDKNITDIIYSDLQNIVDQVELEGYNQVIDGN